MSLKYHLTLELDEIVKLQTYLRGTTHYRVGEIEACAALGAITDESGKLKFPNYVANAQWWREAHEVIGRILEKLDSCPLSVERDSDETGGAA